MRGKHHIIVESDKLKYEFDIKRNITVIQGDSATGKTTLIDLLSTYGRFREESGIFLQSDVKCVVYSGDESLWKSIIDAYQDSIIFFDEDYSFIFSKEFSEKIRNSSNYYVIITRQPLYELPYSVQEIYGIRTSGKYHFPEKVYHEFYRIYEGNDSGACDKALVLLEDTKSGYQFYSSVGNKNHCESVGGNSGFVRKLAELPRNLRTVVIADGAAFGAYVSSVYAVARNRKDVMMYFPESFEWVILKSGIIEIKDIQDILANPEDYIESNEYFSWERYFTDILVKATGKDSVMRYDKSKLLPFYLEGKNKEEILRVLPDEIRKALEE